MTDENDTPEAQNPEIAALEAFERAAAAALAEDEGLSLRERLERSVLQADWTLVRPHLHRGALIVVDPEVPLVEAAVAVCEDQSRIVAAWIESGHLSRPSAEQIQAWTDNDAVRFDCVIARPYVLAAIRSAG